MQRMRQRRVTELAPRLGLFVLCLALTISSKVRAYPATPESLSGLQNQRNSAVRPTPIPQPVGKVEYMEACLRVLVIGSRDTSFWMKAEYVSRIGTRLQFSLESPAEHRLLLTYEEDEQLTSMFVIGQNLVVTVGEIGDHSVVRIFRLGTERVKVVFSRAAQSFDFVNGPSPAAIADTVLIYTGRVMRGNYIMPTEAEIYDWNGKAFTLKAKVPYEKRFRALADMEQQANK